MELDELKLHWNEISKESPDSSIERRQLHQMITMQSKTLISNTGRRLRTKARTGGFVGLLTLFFGIATLLFKDDQSSSLDVYFPYPSRYYMMIFMSSFILFIAWYNRQQYLKLIVLEQSSHSIKDALQATISRLHKVMKASILSDTIGAPVIVLWITYIQLYWGSPFIMDTRVLSLSGITLVSIPIIYFVARHGQHNKYGEHLQSLKECLTEIDTIPTKTHSHASN